MTWTNFYLLCFFLGFALSLLSLLGGFASASAPLRLPYRWGLWPRSPHARRPHG